MLLPLPTTLLSWFAVQALRSPRIRISRVIPFFIDSTASIKHVVLLSGTPTPEDVRDIYIPLRMIGVIPQGKSFRDVTRNLATSYLPRRSWLEARLADSEYYMRRSEDGWKFRTNKRSIVCLPEGWEARMRE